MITSCRCCRETQAGFHGEPTCRHRQSSKQSTHNLFARSSSIQLRRHGGHKLKCCFVGSPSSLAIPRTVRLARPSCSSLSPPQPQPQPQSLRPSSCVQHPCACVGAYSLCDIGLNMPVAQEAGGRCSSCTPNGNLTRDERRAPTLVLDPRGCGNVLRSLCRNTCQTYAASRELCVRTDGAGQTSARVCILGGVILSAPPHATKKGRSYVRT